MSSNVLACVASAAARSAARAATRWSLASRLRTTPPTSSEVGAIICSARASRAFSSAPPNKPRKIGLDDPGASSTGGSSGSGSGDAPPPHGQDFVKVRLEPGEWDDERTDPIHRPPWKSKARIISAEDFANRPKAGFGEEFASLHDAMVTLTWMTQQQRDEIYQTYLDMMTTMAASDRGVTSHEYAMRVIAQKHNITANRAAAIVQLQHEEDRMRKEKPDQKIHYKLQEFVDAKVREHIDEAYEMYGETNPEAFVEDPMGVSGYGDPDGRVRSTVAAEDLFDVDDLVRKTVVRERDEAQLAIDGHVYVEDVDDASVDVKVSAECLKLIQAKNATTDAALAVEGIANKDGNSDDGFDGNVGAKLRRPDEQAPFPENGRGIGGVWSDRVESRPDGGPARRPRWKFAAKTINTRDEKRRGGADNTKKARSRRKKKAGGNVAYDEDVQNTLIEHDGRLRAATAAEVSAVAWKPVRHRQEFTYRGVKRAWVGHKLRGEKGGWGKVERDLAKEEAEAEAEAEAARTAVEDDDGDGEGEEKEEDDIAVGGQESTEKDTSRPDETEGDKND